MTAKVLIVEDESLVSSEIQQTLEKIGYSVVDVVDTGVSAINKAIMEKPDIILMDIHLKGEMDGAEAAKIIVSVLNIPIIFLITFNEEEKLEQANLTLPFGYLLKPIREKNLKTTIETALYTAKIEAERKRAEELLLDKTYKLGERIKELNCLYGISELIEKPGVTLIEIYQKIVDLIPPAWRYPDITCARLIVDCREYRTDRFQVTTWVQRANIVVHGRIHGLLEVFYMEERLTVDEGPFLKEERNLINAVTERLGRIIERKQMEEALIQSQKKYQDLYENAPEMYVAVNAETTSIIECNQTLVKTTGFSKKEIIGRSVFDMYTPESATYAREEVFPHFIKTGKIEGAELQLQRKDGSAIEVSLNGTAVRDSEGNIIHCRSIWHDISDRKRIVEERLEMERQLLQAQKMESLGILAGGIAHDFNNILFQILGYTQLALGTLRKEDELNNFLMPIEKATKRASVLVRQILSFSRGIISELQPAVIQSVIKESLQLLRSSLPATIEIRQHIDEQCGPVLADIVKIYQLIMNLCTNAFHAMREKGGTLTVGLTEIFVSVENAVHYPELTPGAYLELTVTDTGHGMDQETKARMFDPLFTTKKGNEGSGLGLNVVKKIVNEHNGAISVYTAPGDGTTFRVYFPRTGTNKVNSSTIKSMPETLLHGSEKIMIVDDDHSVIAMEQELLKQLGYRVSCFINSPDALKAFQINPHDYDLVITDQIMPDMSGTELTEYCVQIRPDIPVILLTGYGDVINEQQALDIGVRRFIIKPLDINHFSRSIREILDNKPGIEFGNNSI